MTGCPNGCARPYTPDIGFVGKTLGKYTIYVGGNLTGTRLAFIYKDLVPFDDIVPSLLAAVGPVQERATERRIVRRLLPCVWGKKRSSRWANVLPFKRTHDAKSLHG